MRERAEKQAPDAFWIFHSGQGGGAFSLDVPIQAAVAARLDGYAVTIETVTADRFLRTGTYLATRMLRAAGIRTDFSEERVDRNYLAGRAGDAINAVLAAVGYNFRRLLAWFGLLLSVIWIALVVAFRPAPDAQTA